jgi:hypothetical protein
MYVFMYENGVKMMFLSENDQFASLCLYI